MHTFSACNLFSNLHRISQERHGEQEVPKEYCYSNLKKPYRYLFEWAFCDSHFNCIPLDQLTLGGDLYGVGELSKTDKKGKYSSGF